MQTNVSTADFIQHVTPVVAVYLSETFKPINSHLGTYKASFIRYVSGQISLHLKPFARRDQALTIEKTCKLILRLQKSI